MKNSKTFCTKTSMQIQTPDPFLNQKNKIIYKTVGEILNTFISFKTSSLYKMVFEVMLTTNENL